MGCNESRSAQIPRVEDEDGRNNRCGGSSLRRDVDPCRVGHRQRSRRPDLGRGARQQRQGVGDELPFFLLLVAGVSPVEARGGPGDGGKAGEVGGVVVWSGGSTRPRRRVAGAVAPWGGGEELSYPCRLDPLPALTTAMSGPLQRAPIA